MRHARGDYDRFQDPAEIIPKDEPVFLLRGKDVCAPKAVRVWADLAEMAGASPEIVVKARAHAREMERWQEAKGAQVPDL